MRLSFAAPNLRALDATGSEVLCCTKWRGRGDHDGVASLCDWRLSGGLSKVVRSGLFTGNFGDTLLVPGRPKLPCDKLLVFGAGEPGELDETRFRTLLASMLGAIADLAAQSVVIELPGRQCELIAPELAADVLLEALTASGAKSERWTLVEDAVAQRRIEQHMVEERRRIRHAP